MTFFVLLGVFLLIGGVLWIGGKIAASENPEGYGKTVAWASLGLATLAIVLTTIFSSFHVVENGHIGIVKAFGNLVGTTDSGLVTTAPWQSLEQVSVRNELRTYDMTTHGNSAVSSDTQPVFLLVQVNHELRQDKAVSLYVKTGGDFINRILDPAVFRLTKEVTAEYKAIEFAANREKIGNEIARRLQATVGAQGIHINAVSIKDFNVTDDLSKAIEQTVEAEQQAKREQARVSIVQAQADQAIAKAQGTATSAVKAAKGEAAAIRLRGRAIRENPQVITLNAIEKLNPEATIIYCTDGNCPVVPGVSGATVVTTP